MSFTCGVLYVRDPQAGEYEEVDLKLSPAAGSLIISSTDRWKLREVVVGGSSTDDSSMMNLRFCAVTLASTV